MQRVVTSLFVVMALSAIAVPLLAHHGRGATYDVDKEVTSTGVVTEVAWHNPHVVLYADVKDANGTIVNWGFEGSSTSTMSRARWTRTTLKPGQEISITFNPSRAGAPFGVIKKVRLADGRELGIVHANEQ